MIKKKFDNPIIDMYSSNCLTALDLAVRDIYNSESIDFGDDNEKLNKILRHLELDKMLVVSAGKSRDHKMVGREYQGMQFYFDSFELFNLDDEQEESAILAIKKFEEFYNAYCLKISNKAKKNNGCVTSIITLSIIMVLILSRATTT